MSLLGSMIIGFLFQTLMLLIALFPNSVL